MKKIIILIGCVVLVVGLAFGLYWVGSNLPTIMSNSSLYTADDLDNAREQGFKTGNANADRIQSLLDEASASNNSLNLQLAVVRAELIEVGEALLNSEISNESKQRLINDLENEIYDLSQYVDELNDITLDLQKQVADLTEENSNLSLEISNIRQELLEAQRDLDDFNNTVIPQYEQIINDLINGAAYNFLVTFIYDDIPTVVYGGYFDVVYDFPVFVSTEHAVFNGWSLDGETLIADTTFTVTNGTVLLDNKITFIALVDRFIDIHFQSNNNFLITRVVPLGTTFANVPDKPVVDNTVYIRFEGWSLDGRNVYVNYTTPLNYSQTFTTIFSYYCSIKYREGSNGTDILPTFFILRNSLITADKIPIPTSYPRMVFRGWKLSNNKADFQIIDLLHYTVTENIVFYAIHTHENAGDYVLYYGQADSPENVFATFTVDINGYINNFRVFGILVDDYVTYSTITYANDSMFAWLNVFIVFTFDKTITYNLSQFYTMPYILDINRFYCMNKVNEGVIQRYIIVQKVSNDLLAGI